MTKTLKKKKIKGKHKKIKKIQNRSKNFFFKKHLCCVFIFLIIIVVWLIG